MSDNPDKPIDKGLERELSELGLVSAGHKPFMLPGQDAKDLGATCRVCGSRQVVYFISNPFMCFERGAYCYPHLLERCRTSHIIPFPIPEPLLNQLKLDMGLALDSRPKHITY